MSMLGSELETLLHVLVITLSELAETGGYQMLLHEPVRPESGTSGYLAGWSTTSTSTRCAGLAISRQRLLGIKGLESQRKAAKCQVPEIGSSIGVEPEAMASGQCGAS